jgi:hypothetical protein
LRDELTLTAYVLLARRNMPFCLSQMPLQHLTIDWTTKMMRAMQSSAGLLSGNGAFGCWRHVKDGQNFSRIKCGPSVSSTLIYIKIRCPAANRPELFKYHPGEGGPVRSRREGRSGQSTSLPSRPPASTTVRLGDLIEGDLDRPRSVRVNRGGGPMTL